MDIKPLSLTIMFKNGLRDRLSEKLGKPVTLEIDGHGYDMISVRWIYDDWPTWGIRADYVVPDHDTSIKICTGPVGIAIIDRAISSGGWSCLFSDPRCSPEFVADIILHLFEIMRFKLAAKWVLPQQWLDIWGHTAGKFNDGISYRLVHPTAEFIENNRYLYEQYLAMRDDLHRLLG